MEWCQENSEMLQVHSWSDLYHFLVARWTVTGLSYPKIYTLSWQYNWKGKTQKTNGIIEQLRVPVVKFNKKMCKTWILKGKPCAYQWICI